MEAPQSVSLPSPSSSPGKTSLENAEVPTPSEDMPSSDEPEKEADLKPDRRSSSSLSSSSSSSSEAKSHFHLDAAEISIPLVVASSDDVVVVSGDGAVVRIDEKVIASGNGTEVRTDDKVVASGDGAAVIPHDWVSWPQPPAQTADDPLVTQAPGVQTMPQPAAEATAAPPGREGFDPGRIPASIFQAKPLTSSSQAEWSVASNESLFSIHGARPSTDLCGFYAGESRSHFDYFYDEAMATAGGGAVPEWKLATVAEGTEPAGAGGSARSDASGGSDRTKQKNVAFQRHESGSGGSSSNFSFAFPILPETTTSPRKRDYAGGVGMYHPLQKEYEQPQPPLASPMSAFEEMTTEEERRRRTGWFCCCGECCGCCWFACSWSSCCCCRRWRWCCDCRCCCPNLCRCNWCLSF